MDLEELKEVFKDFGKSNLSELVIEQNGQKISIKKELRVHTANQIRNNQIKNREGELMAVIGTLEKLLAKKGQFIKKDEKIAIIHKLKLEYEILMPEDGTITAIFIKEGEIIDFNKLLFEYLPQT